MKYILGIDTSCYTTSLAGVSPDGDVLFSRQLLLAVPQGERGLQQSGALFQHLKNLPLATAAIREALPDGEIAAVCSSTRPRPKDDSYMPVFLFSHHLGLAISDLTHTPFYMTSHQENHVMAGLHTAKGPNSGRFLALHLSGGTSEILDVTCRDIGFTINLIGASQDLHAGQFVDRIGVSMGLPFPAGPHLEKLALAGTGTVELTGTVKGLTVSFSGPETQGQLLIRQGEVPYPEIAYAVYQLLIRTISKWILHAVEMGYPNEVLLVGGVSSSRMLREGLKERLFKKDRNIRLYFADPVLSRDNAVGTALLGLQAYKVQGHTSANAGHSYSARNVPD
jgi:N6-L-threonylcarbamoyladenine synthase